MKMKLKPVRCAIKIWVKDLFIFVCSMNLHSRVKGKYDFVFDFSAFYLRKKKIPFELQDETHCTFPQQIDDVSRTNKYGNSPHCIYTTQDHLRKFCHCREPPPPPPEDKSWSRRGPPFLISPSNTVLFFLLFTYTHAFKFNYFLYSCIHQ